MPKTLEDLVMMRPPSAARPLLGTIVLVIEDSRHACEALRLICQRSGARIRRAATIAAAERHLRTYRPGIAVVDLGLPDGSGLTLIEKMACADPRIDGIIAISGDETLREAALAAGADTFLPKPIASVSGFQRAALSLLSDRAGNLVVLEGEADSVQPDPFALRDDLALVAELLRGDTCNATLDYVAGFLSGLAKSAGQPRLGELSDMVRARTGSPGATPLRAIAAEIEDQVAAFEPV